MKHHDLAAALASIEAQAKQASSDHRVQDGCRLQGLYGRPAGLYASMSPLAWIEKHCTILPKNGRADLITANYAQIEFEKLVAWQAKERVPTRVIILKPRQTGFSTWLQCRLFEALIREKDAQCQLIAHRGETSAKILRMLKRMLTRMPKLAGDTWSVQKLSNSRTEVRLGEPFHSRCDVDSAEAEEPGHGDTVHKLHLTEVSRWPNAEAQASSIMQVLPDIVGSLCVMESTANGAAGYFYKLWNDCWGSWQGSRKLDESGFAPLFVSWLEHAEYSWAGSIDQGQLPGYCPQKLYEEIRDTQTDEETFLIEEMGADYGQLAWRRRTWAQKCQRDWSAFNESYPATPEDAFRSTGSPIFDGDRMKALQRAAEDAKFRGRLADMDESPLLQTTAPRPVDL